MYGVRPEYLRLRRRARGRRADRRGRHGGEPRQLLPSLVVPWRPARRASVQAVVPEGREPEPGDAGWRGAPTATARWSTATANWSAARAAGAGRPVRCRAAGRTGPERITARGTARSRSPRRAPPRSPYGWPTRARPGVLDLGCVGPAGFRGWSGGARDAYTIAADWATPGYLPGELEPGSGRCCCGCTASRPQGLEFELGVHHQTAPPRAGRDRWRRRRPRSARPDAAVPEVDGMRWLAGDLHAHTVHSDGVLTIAELAALAVGRGLDFLAVTDHNTVSHHPSCPRSARRTASRCCPARR